ncbi:MAG TPA: hypothetical protein VES01_03460 [Dermatophilaceae bacterium]|nr:hypothetical protein [Dermatophilaceae bacterium]
MVAGLVYAGVGVAASAIVPTDQLAASSAPLLEIVKAAGGVPPALFSLIALVAVGNGALLTGIMSSGWRTGWRPTGCCRRSSSACSRSGAPRGWPS